MSILHYLTTEWKKTFSKPSEIEGRFDFSPRHYRAEHETEEERKRQAVDYWITAWEKKQQEGGAE